ncbi:MAG: hypothetical protein JWP31_1149 [Aeromicrobium sp.]|nr:hypothetical protein [Aeromicrobium sp.]
MSEDGPAGGAKPLAGIRVVSLAEQYPGPFCTMILSDLGAEVILVERPPGGDPTRRFSGHFAALSRGKRSIAVDLKNPEGLAVFRRLASTADVVLEGFRPGVVDRLGIGAKELRADNPGLVFTSISSFGQSGPLSPRASHDLSSQGMAGFVSGGKPLALPIADLASALFAVIGVVSALFARTSSGRGAFVDVSMLDALISLRSTSLVSSLNHLDPAPYPPLDPGYGVFTTSDGGEIALSIAGEDHQWSEMCDVLGLHDIAALTTQEREDDAPRLRAMLETAILGADRHAMERALEDRGVGFGPVHDDQAVADDEHVRARGIITEVDGGGGLMAVRQPVIFDQQPSPLEGGVPSVGEHTVEILQDLGLDAEEIAGLRSCGAVHIYERGTS